ncbi:glutathione S-transferase LANCL1 isoform X1 [Halyomorpha halys]|uniref:glutathione S-transferase LANCL1 isoform X1 n=1 Tax=Halyomorpha halys TaxID=286706 RepID=UPI0034D34F10
MSIDYRKERYILNNYARFLTEGTSFVTANDISTELFQKIEVAEKGLYQQLIDSERQITACSNYSIYVGTTGIAMLYLYKYMKNNDSSALTRGKRIVAEANEKGKYTGISFLRGNAGPLALGFIFNAFASGGSSATELSRRLCALADKDVDSPCELLNGRAGYLYALLFVQKYFNNVISEELLRKQISIILREGVRRAEITPCEAPLVYEWYDTNYLGAAHGLAGILYILLCCSRLLTSKEKNDLIQPTIEWLLTQRFPSGNFKPSTDKDEDNLVQWCHGAPGFVHLFTLASEKAKDLAEKGVSQLRQDEISFLLGDAGPLALAAVVNSKLGDHELSRQFIQGLIDLPTKASSSPPYELLYGRVGYLYALLFVENEIGPIIPVEVIKDCIEAIIEGGVSKAQSTHFPAPLQYEWYNTNYLGAAHGVAGILYVLLCANQFLTEVQRQQIIKPTIDWLKENRFPSGNFKSSYGRDRDSLVHWCHGSPGFVYLFMLAHKVYNNPEYKDLAIQCGDVVWHRGLLKKGYSICHGVSGNAYAFLHLYKNTRDLKYLYQAACFLDWCTTYPTHEGRKPDTPYSLFEGIAGLDYFLTDVQNPEDANFPAFALI